MGITRTNDLLQAKAEIGPIPVMPMADASFKKIYFFTIYI